jgi:MoaA/NifB/PqqE/SkfB family radical SAM enzyme
MRAKRLLNLVADRLTTLPLVILYLTDGCNSRCVTCDIWRNPRRNMDRGLVENLANAFPDLGVRWVLLSGGEAMQHPDWPWIARHLQAAGAHVMLLTNGLLLRKQAAEVKSSVDEVIVSLDGGTRETYRAIRGVDAFDVVLDGIRAVHDACVPVTTRTTIQRANYAEMPRIIDAARAAGADKISFLSVDVSSQEAFGPRFTADPALRLEARDGPWHTALNAAEIAHFAEVVEQTIATYAVEFASGLIAEPPDKLRRMVAYFRALAGEGAFPRPRCNAPHTSVVVEVDGTLRPCYFLPTFGRLDGQLLGAAINARGAQALRKAYRTGQRPECERCVCPLYLGPRSLLRM